MHNNVKEYTMFIIKLLKRKSGFLSLLTACLLLAVLSSCEKDFEGIQLPLAVNSTALTLDTAAGTSHMMVYATGKWKVGLEESSEWLELDKNEGEGNSDFIFSWQANLGAARSATIVVSRDTMIRKIVINQKAR